MQDTYEALATVVETNGWADTLGTIANIVEDEHEDPIFAANLRAFVEAETRRIEDTTH